MVGQIYIENWNKKRMADTHQQLLSTLRRLLQAKTRKPGTYVRITQQTLVMICEISRDVILNEPSFVKIKPPVHVVGDIHGQFYDLLRIFDEVGHPPDSQFLFLGDYVDRGNQSIETLALLLVYKILYPDKIYLLRGNHEISTVNANHGFKNECVSRYSVRLWNIFNEVFNVMPLAASIDDKIFASHAGIPKGVADLSFIETVKRPLSKLEGPLSDLVWSDPDPSAQDWVPNPRGESYCFGLAQLDDFLTKIGFEVLIRAHQSVSGGFQFPFDPDRRAVTIFSAPCYDVGEEDSGAVMTVSEALECSFVTIKQMDRRLLGMRKGIDPIDEILSMKSSISLCNPNRKW